MIPLLEPIFRGDWAPLGEALVCGPPPAGALRVHDLVHDGERLLALLARHARHRGVTGPDLRPATSVWVLDYLGVLLPPVVSAASVLQHGFPVRADEMWVQLDAGGTPRAFGVPHEGRPLHGTCTMARHGALVDGHLGPLFDTIARLTRVARKILWGNAARQLDAIFEQALRLPGVPASVKADRDGLLAHGHLPDGRPNPMHGSQRVVPRSVAVPEGPVRLHRQCCLYHLLPREGYCGACPLAPHHQPVKDAAPSS
jgi:ferric iron reductase protein FhuF